MQQLPYFVIDAFASRLFRGNPAGVCALNDWLPDETLQAIAGENNLSETAFFIPGDSSYKLRWFTPKAEVPLCGHATLATAFAIVRHFSPDLTDLHFDTRSGILTVRRIAEGDSEWYELEFPLYLPLPAEHPPAELEAAIGAEPVEILATAEDLNYYVVVADEGTVRALEPDFGMLAELRPHGVAVTARGASADFVSRYFAPGYGIPEDPVTGSTHTALTPYWAARLQKTSLSAAQLSQRGGELRCRVAGDRVRIAGQAITYLEGAIFIP